MANTDGKMNPIEYYERTETTTEGFTVHCGWYKLINREGTVAYTDGQIYGIMADDCGHLVIWLTNKQSGEWHRDTLPLYGADAGYVAQFADLSKGKIKPVAGLQRIDDEDDEDDGTVNGAIKYMAWASMCVQDRDEPDNDLPEDMSRFIYAHNGEDGQQLARTVFCDEFRSMGYAAEAVDTNDLEVTVTLPDGREIIYLVDVN